MKMLLPIAIDVPVKINNNGLNKTVTLTEAIVNAAIDLTLTRPVMKIETISKLAYTLKKANKTITWNGSCYSGC